MKHTTQELSAFIHHRGMIFSFYCLVLVVWALPGWGNIYFKHLGKTDGLSQISVLSICQDELGRMWFGTLEGLNCYDGNRMRVFKPSQTDANQLVGNEIRNIVSDKQGSLFFNSDGRLLRYDLYKDCFSSLGLRPSTLFAHEGKVWTASADTVYQWNSERGRIEPFYVLPVKQNISALLVDVNNTLWVGTYKGLYRIDHLGGASPVCVIPDIRVLSMYRDTQGRLWVATYRNGMYKVENGASQQLSIQKEFDLSNNDVRCFTEDNAGNIWIGTFNGLNRYAPDGTITYYRKGLRPGELKHPSIFSLYKDQQGTLWVGTYYGGVHYFNPDADIFRHYAEQSADGNGLSFPYVGNMVEDKRGDLWICTEGGGLNWFNRRTGTFAHYLIDSHHPQTSFYNLKCIAYNPDDDCLYVGTHKQGLLCFDVATKRVMWNSSAAGESWSKLEYRNQCLYMQSTKGLFVMKRGSQDMKPLLPIVSEANLENINFYYDSKGYLWLINWRRIVRIRLDNPQEKTVYPVGKKGFGNYPFQRLIEMPDGTLFVGTLGNGIFYYNEAADEFVPCSSIDIDYCYSMCVLPNGYLAISSDRGLLLYHPQTGDRVLVDADSQLHVASFNDGCGLYVCRDGELFVGGVEGMSSFQVEALLHPAPSYNLYFSSLLVNNKTVVVGAPNGILPTAMPLAKRIDLRHNENNVSFSFASNDYVYNAGHQVYEYKLEGFNKEWTTTYGKTIVFTNLNPGRYRLIVREQPRSSKVTVPSITLPIVIHCAWWETWWAILIYVTVIITILDFVIINKRSRMLLRAQLEKEKLEKEKNEELIQAKLQFFANVSHEFRTPLTLIISQIESLLQTPSLSPFLRMRLQKIYRNTFHFRELISELLDFRKLERGKLTLHVAQIEMIAYLRQIYQDFCDQAQLQNLHFDFHSEVEAVHCWCDARQLRKVFTNLLSNAFKYTPERGKVEMKVSDTADTLRIQVIDSGKGIDEASLPLIFDRFYQSDPSVSSPSSGIGLALAKGLVELHHGRIGAQSALEYGSIFTVELPKENPFTDDAGVVMETASAVEQAVLPVVQPEGAQADHVAGEALLSTEETVAVEGGEDNLHEKACVLVVEDNEDLLQILTALLSPLYRVSIAMNGKEGLEKAMEVAPDMILSDVMMPVMDGITMCRQIKNTFEICHIPVILLTALTSDSSKIEGLQCGADDYIEKPFSNKLLMGHIANMLRNRRLLKQKFGRQMITEESSGESNLDALALTPIDASFLRKLEEVVQAHLADTDFDVNLLARELAVSRSSLYNKLKALSALSPNEYILDARLRQAADWLKNRPEMQITDIALQAGFNSLRYFRHCFKARYDQTPQEYRSETK